MCRATAPDALGEKPWGAAWQRAQFCWKTRWPRSGEAGRLERDSFEDEDWVSDGDCGMLDAAASAEMERAIPSVMISKDFIDSPLDLATKDGDADLFLSCTCGSGSCLDQCLLFHVGMSRRYTSDVSQMFTLPPGAN